LSYVFREMLRVYTADLCL